MALVKQPVILQVVGYQNSGKTTFLKQLLEKLSDENFRVGIIKHHGHGGKPDVYEEKDSSLYCQKGAVVSLVEGEGRMLIQAEKSRWTLGEQIRQLLPFDLDAILIEGHKHEGYSKIFIIRNQSDLEKVNELSNIKAIFLRDSTLMEKIKQSISAPSMMLENDEPILWTVQYIKSQLEKSES
jgi:molybdopterin-guanine dinucleotide biosynthesis adapter protein